MSHHHHHHLDLGLCALQADWLALPSSTVTTTTPPAATLIWWRPCDAFFLVRVSLSTICVFALYANQAAQLLLVVVLLLLLPTREKLIMGTVQH